MFFLTLFVAAVAGPTAALGLDSPSAPGAPAAAQYLQFDGGVTTLDGAWQFHLGDDSGWAAAGFDDSGWEQLTADKPWGEQGHANQAGYAWYRRHVWLRPGEQEPKDLAILIPAVEDAYELYWNGQLVGTYGKVPPHPVWYYDLRPKTWGLGPAHSGVLAVRAWKAPLALTTMGCKADSMRRRCWEARMAISAAMADGLQWLRNHQFTFALESLYGLVAVLGFTVWLRDRRQWLAFWMACFAAAKPLAALLLDLKLPISLVLGMGLNQPVYVLGDVSMWYVLLLLLDLRREGRLAAADADSGHCGICGRDRGWIPDVRIYSSASAALADCRPGADAGCGAA